MKYLEKFNWFKSDPITKLEKKRSKELKNITDSIDYLKSNTYFSSYNQLSEYIWTMKYTIDSLEKVYLDLQIERDVIIDYCDTLLSLSNSLGNSISRNNPSLRERDYKTAVSFKSRLQRIKDFKNPQ
jgi:hypothetical protein